MTSATRRLRYLPDCRAEIQERLRAGGGVVLLLDFDGTLAPISLRPEDARMPGGTLAALQRLASTPSVTVAIISGRSLGDLREKTGIQSLILAGNHGLEIQGAGFRFVHPEAAARRDALDRLCGQLRAGLSAVAGAEIEHKGLTATVHYRRSSAGDRHRIAEVVRRAAVAAAQYFEVRQGLMSLEIRPAVDWNKGQAARMIVSKTGTGRALVIYAGDDRTDEDAFIALPDAVSVKVGPPDETAAGWFVHSIEEVASFLDWLSEETGRMTAGEAR